jgi:CarboxypepD_reg-like domain
MREEILKSVWIKMDYPTSSPENIKMEEEKNNNIYSAEFIRKYLDGQLSDQAMQLLEKAALEDPFLADAIEGYEESKKQAVSFETGIADLRTKLAERINQRKRKTGILIQLSKWQVAASLIVIIGLAVFTVTYVNKRPGISQPTSRPEPATATSKKPPQEKINRDDSIKPDEQTIASVKPPKAGKISINKKEKALSQKADETSSGQNNGRSSATVSSDTFTDTTQEKERSEVLAKKDVTMPLAAAAKNEDRVEGYSGIDIKPIASPSGNYIKGVVIDDKGMPIPFAEVNLKGTNRHVFTDTAGFFKLYMKDPRLAALINVQPTGYESVSAELKPDSNITNTIQMHPSSVVLNKTVLLKYNKPPSIVGWDAFYSYIDSNKKINTTDSLLKGEEVISFLLHPDGKLSSFRVEKSVSKAHDAEILRLIRMAPALKSQEKKKQRCQLLIRFK